MSKVAAVTGFVPRWLEQLVRCSNQFGPDALGDRRRRNGATARLLTPELLDHLRARLARRLYHSRDLNEPFDFLTWFEYVPEHADAFEAMVGRLRSTPEWRYVEREVDVRLSRT